MDSRTSLKLNLESVKRKSNEIIELQPVPGKLHFSNGETYEFVASDLIEKENIGTGSYGGVVTKMIHRETNHVMAVKRVRAHEIDTKKREQMLRELKIIIQSQNCEDIVRFYGAIFQDGDCWICMELLDCSLDKFYREVYRREQRLPERAVRFIASAVIRALSYLKEALNIIHRDVKPSNILLDRRGFVKLCDFGISGYLVDSIARTQDVGCQVYMAPERLSERIYDIRSDVWSFGITLVEICIGRFPYSTWNSVFDQLQAVVHGDPPFLTTEFYSLEAVDFVNKCLIKEPNLRPKFSELMEHSFLKNQNILENMPDERDFFGKYVELFIENP